MTRVWHVFKKEIIQTFRDPRMVVIIFVAPILQLFIFGYAITTDIRNINLAVLDHDNQRESRQLLDAFSSSGYFTFIGSLQDDDQLREALKKGESDVVLVIPQDFSKRLSRGEKVVLQSIYDASDSNFAQIADAYTQRIVGQFAIGVLNQNIEVKRSLATMLGKTIPENLPMVSPEVRIWYNPELKSVYYMVPGVTCMLLMVVTMLLTGMALTREKEIGTIEQIIVSPIASWELILGKLAPFGFLGMIDVLLIVGLGHLHFGVPILGSIPLLLASAMLFLFSTLGLGLFFSSISANQQQALFVNFMFLMPAILLSGFMFPIENMPDPIQYLTYFNPMRYFLVVLRGIFLKGNGMEVLWPQLTALAVFGLTIFTLASIRFSKRLA